MTPLHSLPDEDDALDPTLQQAVSALRVPVQARPDAVVAVKAALRAEVINQEPRRVVTPAGRLRWFTTARPLRVSPLGLLAAASLLVVAASMITATVGRRSYERAQSASITPASDASGTQVVRFILTAPNARSVSLVGDFNGWDPGATSLEQENGVWTVVIPVTPGRHQYGFVLDGSTWIADPAAPRSADSDYGSSNSVVYVGS
jgi:hypothetical protein